MSRGSDFRFGGTEQHSEQQTEPPWAGRRTLTESVAPPAAEPPTIFRDAIEGASAQGGAVVDQALGQVGGGTSHPSGANLHTDHTAAAAADALGARAFTAGSDIFFGAGQYAPQTEVGSTLLQHELTHVSQARGAEAPSPGNYRVSDPGDAAEVEARSVASGGGAASTGASPSTIYRTTVGERIATAETGRGVSPEDAAGHGARDGASHDMIDARAAGAADDDPVQAFRLAVTAGRAAPIMTKWNAIPAASKGALAGEKDTLLRAMQIVGPKSIKILQDLTINPGTDQRFAQEILWHGSSKAWAKELGDAGLMASFLAAEPRRTHLDQKSLQHLGDYVKVSDDVAKDAFEKAWATLGSGDVTISGTTYFSVGWTKEDIGFLYRTLLGSRIPPSHLLGLTGIWNCDSYQVGTGPQNDLDYGYWEAAGRMVLPYNTNVSIGRDHNMVGGSGQKGSSMKHLTSTIMHEVGHVVGTHTGEWSWGNDSASPLALTSLGSGAAGSTAAASALWDSSKNHPARAPRGGTADPVSEADAKAFLEAEVRNAQGTAFGSTAWSGAGKDQPSFEAGLRDQYRDQPLYKMAKQVAGALDSAYTHPRVSTAESDKMVAFLSRMGGGVQWYKYNKTAHDKKVSWYSLSSVQEWFAEQYSYYMTSNGGATIPAVKDHLKTVLQDIDTTSGSPIHSPGAGGGAGAGGGGAGAGGAAPAEGGGDAATAGAAATAAPPDTGHRFHISWRG